MRPKRQNGRLTGLAPALQAGVMFPYRLLVSLLFTLLLVPAAQAEEAAASEPGSIEWLVRKFLKERKPGSMSRYYTGELRHLGNRATPGATYYEDKYELDVRINEQDETNAAVAATMSEPKANKHTDFYLFLRKDDSGWKLAAVRSFAPPRGMGQMYAAVAAKGKEVDARDMRELTIMQVLQFNDWGMKQSFQQRREKLDRIAAEIRRAGLTDVVHGGQPHDRLDRKVWQEIHDAMINYVEMKESGTIEFNAASFGRSAVGFLWVPPSGSPPRATAEEYILVEQLDGPWYLYRRQ